MPDCLYMHHFSHVHIDSFLAGKLLRDGNSFSKHSRSFEGPKGSSRLANRNFIPTLSLKNENQPRR